MTMQTGENPQALRKILDMSRMISIILLVLHCYYYLYAAFDQWQLTSTFSDRRIQNDFDAIYKEKWLITDTCN